jgi:hypothetical protein
MRDITAAALDTVMWAIAAWLVGSVIHILAPWLLIYYAPPATLWITSVFVYNYASEDTEDDGLLTHPSELE